MQQLELFQQFERMTRHPLPLLSLCQDVNSDLKSNGLIAKAPVLFFMGAATSKMVWLMGREPRYFMGAAIDKMVWLRTKKSAQTRPNRYSNRLALINAA